METIWKSIKGYEGIYEISNWGDVKSLERRCSHGRVIRERILKPGKNRHGYLHVGLSKDGSQKLHLVHHLVFDTFIGEDRKGMHIDHRSGIKTENDVDNLQLLTHSENITKGWMGKNKSSKYKGVGWDKKKKRWTAFIWEDGRTRHLGTYDSEEDAHNAYIAEAERLGRSVIF